MTLDELSRNALALPHGERALLVDRLVESLDFDLPPETENAQLDEIRRRMDEVDSGKVVLIPAEEALEQVRRTINQESPGMLA